MRKYVPVTLFLFFTIMLFRPVWLQGKLPLPADALVSGYFPWNTGPIPRAEIIATDVFRQQLPWIDLAVSELKQGRLPLWNPYNFSGMPLAANLQSHVWFPWTLIFLFLPLVTAWTLFVISVPVVGMMGMYLFLRIRGLSAAASVFGAVAFASMGFVVLWLPWGFIPYGAVLLPWILWSVERLIVQSRWSLPVTIGLLAVELMSGYVQVVTYVFLFAAFYLIWRLWRLPQKRQFAFRILCALVASFLLAGIQLVSSFEAYQLSAREVVASKNLFFNYMLAPQHLLTILAPNFFGNPQTFNFWGKQYHEFMVYFGIVAFLLAIVRIVSGLKDASVRFFGMLALASLSFALIVPLASVLVILDIPILNSGIPARTLFIFQTAMVILAAEGIDKLYKRERMHSLFGIALVAVVMAGIWISVVTLRAQYEASAPNLALALRSLLIPTALLLSASAVVYLATKRASLARIAVIGLIGLCVFEYTRFFSQNVAFSKASNVFPEHPLIRYLQAQPGYFRHWGYQEARFDHNFATYYRLFSAEGFDSLYPQRYGEFLASSKEGKLTTDILRSDAVIPVTDSSLEQRLLDLLSVRFVLARTDREDKGLPKRYRNNNSAKRAQFGNTLVYENPTALPRAYLVTNWKVIPDREKRIEYLYHPGFQPHNEVVLGTVLPMSPATLVAGSATITEYNPGKVTVNTQSSQDTLLVLTDQYYPGWKARVDEKDTSILQANEVFRAIVVPAGNHRVIFEYKPESFRVGIMLTLVGMALTIGIAWQEIKRNAKG